MGLTFGNTNWLNPLWPEGTTALKYYCHCSQSSSFSNEKPLWQSEVCFTVTNRFKLFFCKRENEKKKHNDSTERQGSDLDMSTSCSNTKTFFRGSKHKFSKMSSLTKSNVKFLDKPIISMALKAQMWEDFNVPIMASSLRLKKVPFWRVKEHAHCHFGPCINITVITKPIQRSIFIIQFKRISPGG